MGPSVGNTLKPSPVLCLYAGLFQVSAGQQEPTIRKAPQLSTLGKEISSSQMASKCKDTTYLTC